MIRDTQVRSTCGFDQILAASILTCMEVRMDAAGLPPDGVSRSKK